MDHKREHWTPPLARVMGVGRQQHGVHGEVVISGDDGNSGERVMVGGLQVCLGDDGHWFEMDSGSWVGCGLRVWSALNYSEIIY